MRGATLETWLRELADRNRDNVARTESYLELYAHTVAHPPDLPWVLMAHLVSRNAGHWMSELASRRERHPEQAPAVEQLFLLLERANFLIFHDAWFHTISSLLGRSSSLPEDRVASFMRSSWRRYEEHPRASVTPDVERQLVFDLVTNEQNYIEHRVVHAPRFEMGLAMIRMIEASGKERPIALPLSDAEIKVEGFEHLDRRIRTGQRIFDEVLADRARRAEIFEWAKTHPHTGDRAVLGHPKPSAPIRVAWPVEQVRALDASIHAEPEHDPAWV